MKSSRTAFVCGLLALTAVSARAVDSLRMYELGEAVVLGRNIRDIGVTKTTLDTVALRDNITNSLGDVLSQNTSIFIKSYGRATMSSASFRGTAPSHTQVTWNGIKMNSPMLGMVDFSLIPSFFVDDVTLYHGAGSVGITGGGLGGAIALGTNAPISKGLGLNFIQGISSYDTYDEFLKVTYGGRKWQSSTRVSYASSDNDFKYKNYEKDGYPIERNKSGQFNDLHILQELYYQPDEKNWFSLTAWYLDADRGVPIINVKYDKDDASRNDHREQTLRTVAAWDRYGDKLTFGAKLGYVYSNMRFHFIEDNGPEAQGETLNAQSFIHTGFANFSVDYQPTKNFLLSFDLSANVHAVSSEQQKVDTVLSYDKSRAELSALLTAKYRFFDRLGVGVDLRGDTYGRKATPLIPAGFVDYILVPKYNVVLKASVARNYRYPTMNDLYFLPGGNDSLSVESGFTYDVGVEFGIHKEKFTLTGEATWYDSHIKDWIVWLPDHRGFWTPINVKKVHSSGIELRGTLSADLGRDWGMYLHANWGWTRSINHGEPFGVSEGVDESIGKQLVYVPEFSSAVTGCLTWKDWGFTYKYCYYSERFATSSNERNRLYLVLPYHMNDISLERKLRFGFADISLKLAVNNLFDEEYISVLGYPMAGRNYGFFLGITPKWGRGNK